MIIKLSHRLTNNVEMYRHGMPSGTGPTDKVLTNIRQAVSMASAPIADNLY
jgi:hypothetical protein